MNDPRYSVEHETHYSYTAPVTQSWQLARLTPRVLPWRSRPVLKCRCARDRAWR